ncbi:MAG TPA: Z1 domain-containing protein [Chthoniobacteraceae bacterium]|nr:Z1 domain-containing protein [Opitutaceae bacterium]HWB58074.1 Z1 domain-containing protein [Chthoniobacteraceae bacterium]
MNATMVELRERIDSALATLGSSGPKDLRLYLARSRPELEDATPKMVDEMLALVLGTDPNDAAVQLFENQIRDWDNGDEKLPWVADTRKNSDARRVRIHALLKSGPALAARIDRQIPYYSLEPQLVIAKEQRDWYRPKPGVGDYYWSKYVEYLRQKKKWEKISIMSLANSTEAIVGNLADPTQAEAYSSRGLVVGYVQSGKTANFTGLIARAADAGYRYIIVLAGTWNILRAQTQRRIDKELIGRELLQDDEGYTDSPPEDWSEFISHGGDPVDRGHFGWARITRTDRDYRRLGTSLDALELERIDKSKPVYDPVNLRRSKVKLLVIKKHGGIINKLCDDLKKIKTSRNDIPTLVIDDESDQAGLNTTKPPAPGSKEEKQRTETNKAIVRLLNLFPRGQYVGYTATPYANAFVNPNDPEDLFPKDFFVPLDRPAGYMGISDFFDADRDYGELDPEDFTEKEIAFIRRVTPDHGDDSEALKTAIRSYVLAGAIKLFREAKDARLRFRHHTMLVHTSARTNEHRAVAARLRRLWNACAFITPNGRDELKRLWDSDFLPVSIAQSAKEPMPKSFQELVPYVSQAIQRITDSQQFILMLNSDSMSSPPPDFNSQPVWKIIVGGNKLSRGYTLEDLTVSYYRRNARTGDALMQMGRWFGFRKGYKDLVRVFLGVEEGANNTVDLVERFKGVCLMEERFRNELKRYATPAPGERRIRPQDIPPLVAMIGQLPPTSPAKMFNAVIDSRNFGGQFSTPTLVAADKDGTQENVRLLGDLAGRAKETLKDFKGLGGVTDKGKTVSVDAFAFELKNADLVRFLEHFRWLNSEYKRHEKPREIHLQIDFLKNQAHGIGSWLALLPQMKTGSFGPPLDFEDELPSLTVKERQRIDNRGFKVFGESSHRLLAKWLCAQLDPEKEHIVRPSHSASQLGQNAHRGIIMLFPVREEAKERRIYVGYELLFPENELGFQTSFTVRRKDAQDRVVVSPGT